MNILSNTTQNDSQECFKEFWKIQVRSGVQRVGEWWSKRHTFKSSHLFGNLDYLEFESLRFLIWETEIIFVLHRAQDSWDNIHKIPLGVGRIAFKMLSIIKDISSIWHNALHSTGDQWDTSHPFFGIYYSISMKQLTRKCYGKIYIKSQSWPVHDMISSLSCYTIGSKAQGHYLVLQRFCPLAIIPSMAWSAGGEGGRDGAQEVVKPVCGERERAAHRPAAPVLGKALRF